MLALAKHGISMSALGKSYLIRCSQRFFPPSPHWFSDIRHTSDRLPYSLLIPTSQPVIKRILLYTQ